jgi:hypothetical protein
MRMRPSTKEQTRSNPRVPGEWPMVPLDSNSRPAPKAQPMQNINKIKLIYEMDTLNVFGLIVLFLCMHQQK